MHPTVKAARIAGAIYLSMVITGPFSLIYVPSKLIVRGNAAATADNILAHETMFRLSILADLVGQVIFICLAIALYRLLSGVNKIWAALMVAFVLVSAAVGFVNTLNDIAALILFRGADFLAVFDKPQRDALGMLFIRLHSQGILIDEMFWGLWLFPFGLLVYRSGFLPRFIGVWLMINCFGYVVLSVTALILSIFAGFIAYWRSTSECDRKTVPSNPMKAIVQCEYGSPDLLKFEDVEKPVPNDNQVCIKVRAASLNFIDAGLMRSPFLLRLMTGGLRKPKKTELGSDVAGQVEAIGKNVTQFKPGDEVFGLARPSLAEYVCARERALVIKPANVTFEQAGSVAWAGFTALQGLRQGNIQPGQKVLINGATGGVGTFAVQIAKSLGAEVTGVCSTGKLDLVRSIGADHVIDYTKEDFTKGDQRYDVIFDNVCNHSFADRRRVLTPNGVCVLAGIGGAGLHPETWGRIVGNFKADLLSRFVRQKFVTYVTKLDKEDLKLLSDLIQTGKVTPVIDRTYKLSETAEAMKYFETGRARGKIVITMN